MPFRGRTLLEGTVDAVAPLVDELLVVGPWAPPGYRHDLEPVRYEGPLSGLAHGLARVGTRHALVLGCDHPLLVRPLLGRLLARRREADAVVPVGPHGPEWLVAVYATALAEKAVALLEDGERRLQALLDAVDVLWIGEDEWKADDPDGRSFLDVDWPEDMEHVRPFEGS